MPQWQFFDDLQPYLPMIEAMNRHVEQIKQQQADEAVWVLSHEAVYTGGTSATDEDILTPSNTQNSIPFIETGRGGQWTYHGPGIRIAYPLLDLNHRQADLRLYVHTLEAWVIDILACFGIDGHRRDGLPGVWVKHKLISSDQEAPVIRYSKIAALGVRVSKWVTAHGFAINLNPDLSAFEDIVPCGVSDAGVTSFAELGLDVSMAELDMAIKDCFKTHFGTGSVMGKTD